MTTPISEVQVTIEAARELVFEMAGAVGGTLPGGPPHHAELISRDGDLLVVRYSAPPPFQFFGFLEEVQLSRPSRIDYRVLKGPLDRVEEWLLLDEPSARRTLVTYGGLVESGIPVIGSLVERLVAVPAYRWYMRRTLTALKVAAERRASRSRRYPAGQSTDFDRPAGPGRRLRVGHGDR